MSGIGRVASGVVVGCVLVLGGAAAGFGGNIVITEIMNNPGGPSGNLVDDRDGEWFELYNDDSDPMNMVDINGWTVEEADGSPSFTDQQRRLTEHLRGLLSGSWHQRRQNRQRRRHRALRLPQLMVTEQRFGLDRVEGRH